MATDPLAERVRAIAGGHYRCDEDSWYSCPKSPEGSCNDSKGGECDCDFEARVNQILAFAQEIRSEADEKWRKRGHADDLCFYAVQPTSCAHYEEKVREARAEGRSEALAEAATWEKFNARFAAKLQEFGTIDRLVDAYREAKMEARAARAEALREAEKMVVEVWTATPMPRTVSVENAEAAVNVLFRVRREILARFHHALRAATEEPRP